MATIYHQVRMNAPTAKLYRAISTANGIASWWDKPTDTQTDVGSVLEFNLGAEHGALKMKVLEQLPGKRVEWECISTHPKTSPASSWTGTHVIFEITERVPMRLKSLNESIWRFLIFVTPAGMKQVSISDTATSVGARPC